MELTNKAIDKDVEQKWLEWADNELDLARNEDHLEDAELYSTARVMYHTMIRDWWKHGYSMEKVLEILHHLSNHEVLVPISEENADWKKVYTDKDDTYQSQRYSSLRKKTDTDGTVRYSDISRVICQDANDPKSTWFHGFVTDLVDGYFPITLPYLPHESKPIRVKITEGLSNEDNGTVDTMAVQTIVDPSTKTILNVCRYFKSDAYDFEWMEIDYHTYLERMMAAEVLKKRRGK
jgi:hypothetical protein